MCSERPSRRPVAAAVVTLTAAFWLASSFVPLGAEAQPAPPDDEAKADLLEAAVAEAMKPGPEHQRLAALAGTWNMRTTLQPGAGAPALKGTGTAVNRMILGGRFLSSEAKGTLGQSPIESLTVFGFDRRAKRFTVVAYDTEGTYYVTGAGTLDASGKLVMAGEDRDPMTDVLQRYEFVFSFPSPDRYVLELFFHQPDGSRFRVVETVYTRRK